ncbi:geranylgeranyl pyrophosphate synthetase [Lecanora helva]
MGSGDYQSPNAIPPRRSSTGLGTGLINPTQPVLKPVPERSWFAQEAPRHLKQSSITSVPEGPSGSSSSEANTPDSADSLAKHVHGTPWSAEKEKIVMGPFDYMYDHPGKDIRKQLIAAFNAWLKVPEESLAIITQVVGMLHTASLLVDDVEDSSLLRRGIPVAHSIFGTAQTINSANYIYFCALSELQKLRNPKAIEIYTDELQNLHRGQGMDLFWRDTLTCPSEDDYLEMVSNKTGGLFRLAIKLMQAECPHNDKDYTPLSTTLSLLFQIRDDYLNLSSPTYTTNKGLCEDLTEGKFSFPIIHAIRSSTNPSPSSSSSSPMPSVTNNQNSPLLNILAQKTKDDEVKRYAVAYMERCGSFEYTRRFMREVHARAVGLMEEVDAGRGCQGGVRGFADRLVEF